MPYLLKITTWENDGDYRRTTDIKCKREQEVEFFLMVARLFASSDGDDNLLGNEEVEFGAESKLWKVLDPAIAVHRATGGWVSPDWDKEYDLEETARMGDDFYSDLVHDLIGTWEVGMLEANYRVFDSFQVLEIPEDGIPDVTSRFK